MLYAKRVSRFFERLASPDEQTQAPKGVLLYSPNLLRFVAVLSYLIWVIGYINNFFFSDFFRQSFSEAQVHEFFYSQTALVLVGAIGTGLVVYFARTRYRGCMLVSSMLAVTSGMVASVFMYGLNINPHMLLAITPLLLIGFTVGRDGLLMVTAWIIANYIWLYIGDALGWWPRPTDISVDVVKHENLSAFIILLLIVTAVEFYVVKIAVTLRKQGELHQALEKEQQQRVELLSRLLTVRDEERQQLAHALHEGPVQDLVALQYGVENGADRERLMAIIEKATQQLRTVSRDLHPSELELYGLPTALNNLAQRQEHDSNIEVEVSCPSSFCCDKRVAAVLYRIAQEALNNVRKHSGAQHAWVYVTDTDNTITLEVQDDGHGFNVDPVQREAVRTGHLGLATVHELALAVNGKLQLVSSPGAGTTVRIAVPIDLSTMEDSNIDAMQQHQEGE